MRNVRKIDQAGVTLLEVIFLTSTIVLASVMTMQTSKLESDNTQARMAGTVLSQYNNAVRSYVSRNIGKEGDFTGTSWLKASTCGGSSLIGYLPCDFPEMSVGIPLPRGRLQLATHIRSIAKPVTAETRAITVVTAYKLEGKARSDLSSIAALVVASTKASNKDETSTDGKVYSDPQTGEITMEASNIAGGDAWLRVDGGNAMANNLTFNNLTDTLRDIDGVSALQAFAGEILYLGPISKYLPSITEGVAVGMNTDILGKLHAREKILSSGNVNIFSGNLVVSSGTITAKTLESVDDASYKIDPNSTSTTRSIDVTSMLVIDNHLQPGVNTIDQVCESLGSISSDISGRIMTCIKNKWTGVSKSPRIYRYPFYEDQDWVVPDGVLSAYVSMAGGGGTGLGWRSVNYQAAGHSGGYVLNHPLNLVPGETLRIVIGKNGDAGQGPINSFVPPAIGPPNMMFVNPDANIIDGLSGYPGTSSILTSVTRGTKLIECSGGSGAVMNGYSSLSPNPQVPGPIVDSPLYGVMKDYALATHPTPSRPATGEYALDGGPGACGPLDYGRGNSGEVNYEVTSGGRLGGLTALGFGSGGDVGSSGCYISSTSIGTCIWPMAGKPGVIFIDVLY